MALEFYNVLLREDVKDRSKAYPEDSAYLISLKHICVLAFVRQRKNYTTALLGMLDSIRHWKLCGHSLLQNYLKAAYFYDEAFGEIGIHAYLRKHVDWTQSTDQAIRQALWVFASRS